MHFLCYGSQKVHFTANASPPLFLLPCITPPRPAYKMTSETLSFTQNAYYPKTLPTLCRPLQLQRA